MKNGLLTLTLVAIGVLSTALFAANKPVTVTLKDGMGKDVGTAHLSDGPGGKGVKIDLDLRTFRRVSTLFISTRPTNAKHPHSQLPEAISIRRMRITE